MNRYNWEKQVKNVVNLVKQYAKGSTIQHDKLESAIGIDRYASEYLYIITKARQELMKSGIIIKSVMGEGYKILDDNEVADYVYDKYLLSSLKKQECGLEIIKYTDKSNLNKYELEKLAILNDLIKNVNDYSSNELVKSQIQLSAAKAKLLGE